MGEHEEKSGSPGEPGRLGKYDIVARLGQGGMSKVYLAVAHGAVDEVRKLVVLKVLHDHLVDDEEYVEMFLREARVAVELSHPNVVHTYTVGEEDGRYCIVMEYINGVPLSQVLSRARQEKWSLEKRMPLLGALCMMLSGLNYVHDFRDPEGRKLRLVHRDLKPGNVLLGFNGQVKLLDFGVVKMTAPEHDQTERLSLKGTVQYLAPEALQGGTPIDGRYDVFAAGLMLWEIVTLRRLWGKRPPLEVMRGLAENEMARIIDEAPDVPEELRPVLLKALAADRDIRFSTASDLKSAIQSFLQREGQRIDPEAVIAILDDGFGTFKDERQDVVSRRLREIREGVVRGEPEALAPGPESLSSGTTSATGVGSSLSSMTPQSPVEPTVSASPPVPDSPDRSRHVFFLGAALALPLLAGFAYFGLGLGRAESSTPPPVTERAAPQAAAAQAHAAPTPAPSPALDPAPESIAVTIRVSPDSAVVEVDGEVDGGHPTVLEGTDPTASHRVVVRADGYVTESLDVELTRTRTLEIDLQPLGDAPADPAPPTSARPRPRRRGQRPAAEPAAAPPAAPTPASPRPGDDITVKKKTKRGAESSGIDSEIPWK